MSQPIQGGNISQVLKSLFSRLFKDILAGFDDANYKGEKEDAIDLSKSSNRPKDSKIRDAVESIDPENRKGMKQTFKHKEKPKEHGQYEVRTYDLSEAEGYEGCTAAEIYDAETGKLLRTCIGKTKEFNKLIKEEIEKLMKDEAKKHPEVDTEDETGDVSSCKRLNLTLRKITGSTDIDYQLTNLSSNYPITIVKDDLPAVLQLDELYHNLSEGDNDLSVEVTDDEFTITDMLADYKQDSRNVLQQFFDPTVILYRFAYSYYFLHREDKGMEQIMTILKDIMDQIASDLADECETVEFPGIELDYSPETDYDEVLNILETTYVDIYNDVICTLLSLDKQEAYDILIRQLLFIVKNM